MTDEVLTAERILETAEEVLRRYGPDKATVVDVARALGVSHGSVYRHFPSKAALRDAVTERWLERISAPLAGIAAEEAPATDRLLRWLKLLSTAKRRRALEEPELFETYMRLSEDAREVIAAHKLALISQLSKIVADGVARGELVAAHPVTTATAIFHATARFHNPLHAAEWGDPWIEAAFDEVCALMLSGLAPRTTARTNTPSRMRA